jgi:hypothetical protein
VSVFKVDERAETRVEVRLEHQEDEALSLAEEERLALPAGAR